MQTMISYFFGQNNEKTTTAATTTTVKCCISFSTQVFAETKSRHVNRTFRKVLSHFSLKSLGNSSGKFAQRSEGLYYIPLFINTSLTFKFASFPRLSTHHLSHYLYNRLADSTITPTEQKWIYRRVHEHQSFYEGPF